MNRIDIARPAHGGRRPGKQLNLLIAPARHKALKRYAAEQDKTMSQLVSEWIDEHAPSEASDRTLGGSE
jgi:predicted HicB family RNase H-like nuclease